MFPFKVIDVDLNFQKRDTSIYLYKDVFLVLRKNLRFC